MMTDEKLDLLCGAVQSINENVIQMKTEITGIKTEITGMKTEIAGIKTEIAEMKSDITGLKADMASVKADMAEMKNDMDQRFAATNSKIRLLHDDVKETRLTIENDIKTNISIIAEGHDNLNRKLDEAIESANTIELTKVRVCVLEEEVKRIKTVVNL